MAGAADQTSKFQQKHSCRLWHLPFCNRVSLISHGALKSTKVWCFSWRQGPKQPRASSPNQPCRRSRLTLCCLSMSRQEQQRSNKYCNRSGAKGGRFLSEGSSHHALSRCVHHCYCHQRSPSKSRRPAASMQVSPLDARLSIPSRPPE